MLHLALYAFVCYINKPSANWKFCAMLVLVQAISKPFLGKLGKKTNLFLLLLSFYYYYLSQIFQIAAFNSSSLYHEIFLSHEILKCGKIPWMPEDMAYCDGVSFVTWSEWGRWASNWTLVVFHWSRHCLPLNCSNGTVWTGEKAVKSNNVKKAVFTLFIKEVIPGDMHPKCPSPSLTHCSAGRILLFFVHNLISHSDSAAQGNTPHSLCIREAAALGCRWGSLGKTSL